MATRFSLIPQVIDGLVAGMRASSGFRAPDGTGDGVTVYDGPEWIGVSGKDPEGRLIVGYGGEDLEVHGDDEAPNAIQQDTEIRAISTSAPRDQMVVVPCVAYAWLGYEDASAARTAVFAVVDAVESWLTSNPRCNVATQADGSQVMHATASGSHEFRQYRVGGGSRAVVEFTITAKTRT